MKESLPNTQTTISHYRIIKKLCAGGMGEVYLAQDTKLERTVALKVLPADVADDKQRMQRFIREAKTASALNHPNILTIFEIGHADSTHFIATEFIDGETLRQHMKSTRMKLGEGLNVAIQTADALSAAHEAGIIHRDIKPENIMLRHRDAYVKVLDFGLAKLIEQYPIAVDTEAATKSLFKTDAGVVLGTVIYMSPEQARGLEVDARTDIWSLGVVLYEMVAGCLPFEGSTTSDVLAAIINEKEPPPLARFAREVPAELERIVEKAVRKDREERYQTAKDMLLDLKRLKRKLEVEAEIERTVPPELRGAAGEARPSGGQEAISTAQASAAQTATVESARTTSSAEYIIREIKRHKRGVAVTLSTIILLSVAGIAYYFYSGRGGSRAAIDSIAVLPLVNTSGDPNTEYLSDGISEALINSLTELQQLRVIARATAFRYKGREIDPQAVGRELNVRAVLMGRVRQVGDAVNIQVDLVDATTGGQLWGQEYERKVSDMLSVKQTIAREVTEKLRLRLSGEEQRRLAKRDTTNAEAYQFYLRGRYFWNKRTADGIKKAIGEFHQVIERDPNYALGYVGLADCYAVLEQYAGTPASETLPKAKAAALRALQIDESLAEAHTSLGYINTFSWQFGQAEKELKRGIELNPNYPTAHQWYGVYLRAMGRVDEAMAEFKRAQQLDPLSPTISSETANLQTLKGDLNSAIEQCKKTIELDPSYSRAYGYLGWAYLKQGREQEAMAALQKAVEVSGRASQELGFLGYGYAALGKRSEAMAIARELEEKYAKKESPAMNLAAVYAGLGEKDQAFVWLERDFQARSGVLIFIAHRPVYEPLRDDPRYTDLLRRIGLKP